jgi:general secretion pathway protein M
MSAWMERVETAYAGLQPREQLFVRVAAILLGVLLVVGLPLRLHSIAKAATTRVATKQADLAYLQSVLPLLASAPAVQDSVPLVSVVDASTRDVGLASELRGTEPSGNDALRVRFEGASFAQLTNWFVQLSQNYGVGIEQATLERTDTPGRINASIVIVRH